MTGFEPRPRIRPVAEGHLIQRGSADTVAARAQIILTEYAEQAASDNRNALIVIPARFASTRFPGKVLEKIGDKPMIQHVYERARETDPTAAVLVATDDPRIAEAVRLFGGDSVFTDSSHPSGTDRIAEVARNRDETVILNIQGDEPFISPADLRPVIRLLQTDSSIDVVTLRILLESESDFRDPNVVKVVSRENGDALYFSRASIPSGFPGGNAAGPSDRRAFRHVGVYGYKRQFLLEFANRAPSSLEKTERLEQLRFLEMGARVRVLDASEAPVGVDTPEDLERVRHLYSRRINNSEKGVPIGNGRDQ